MIVRIIRGAPCFQDFKFPQCGRDIGVGEEDRPFKVRNDGNGKLGLVAFGYGLTTTVYGPKAYGSGAIYTCSEYIEELSPDAEPEVYVPIDCSKEARLERLVARMQKKLSDLGCKEFEDETAFS